MKSPHFDWPATRCPANWLIVSGISSSDEAKIGGITPAVLTFSGRNERSPPAMRLPSWRFGYWIRRRRWARSMKTMKATMAAASTWRSSASGNSRTGMSRS